MKNVRDPRWEKVWASIGHRYYDIDRNEYNPPEHITRIYVEVVHDGWMTWEQMDIYTEDLEEFSDQGILKQILDEMIYKIDVVLNRRDNGALDTDS